ncbi:hypothetical protein FVR03_04200 [Pontibacter qinzhouensis]|uniref:Uncharacterized protein n=1 Tax=Pontibacter qinzhouensis TaxID=2603253 RepID=A0A5C8KCG9_9BACT|nr:hypothetical protein [Pontibacter qinzhouensis]TXK50862.1 hypothetical protein FVR03_04200 [Pontibacter qinzhouensis]
MATGTTTAKLLRGLGLNSTNRSIFMLVLVWLLNVAWLGINYFWRIASLQVLVGVQILLLVYGAMALVAYVYWGLKQVREQDAPYSGVLVGVIVAITLLYFNVNLLQYVLALF